MSGRVVEVAHVSHSRAQLYGTGAQANTQVIAAPGALTGIRIHDLCLSVSGASQVVVSEGDHTSTGSHQIQDVFIGDRGVHVFRPFGGHKLAANKAVKVTTSGGDVRVVILYDQVQ